MTIILLKISALIAILISFTMATTALVKKIHTAHYMNALNKNIIFALIK